MSRLLSMLRLSWRRDLWVLPALIVAGGAILGVTLVLVDPPITWLQELSPRLFTVSPDGARGVLTAIATAMLSVAGVVFSITIATLSLTSQQFTSRVLRTFVRDRGNQAVLGVFLGVFAYSLVVLRSVRSPDEGVGYVPQLAVLVAFALAMLGVAFLIYFISHTASSIQASQIVSRIAADTISVLKTEEPGEPLPPLLRLAPATGSPVVAEGDGYVRGIELGHLAGIAETRDWRIRFLVPVGAFVTQGEALARIVDASGRGIEAPPGDAAAIRRSIRLAASGDVDGDPGFGVRQLVDVALKALSPGVNDVTTALTCIDYLCAVLLQARHLHQQVVGRDSSGQPRVVLPRDDFADLLDEAMDQIRENGKAQVAVLLRQLTALGRLADRETDAGRLALILDHVDRVRQAANRGLPDPAERHAVTASAARLRARDASAAERRAA